MLFFVRGVEQSCKVILVLSACLIGFVCLNIYCVSLFVHVRCLFIFCLVTILSQSFFVQLLFLVALHNFLLYRLLDRLCACYLLCVSKFLRTFAQHIFVVTLCACYVSGVSNFLRTFALHFLTCFDWSTAIRNSNYLVIKKV